MGTNYALEEIKRLLAAATLRPWRVAGTSGFVENSSSDVATICQFWSNYEIDYDNWEANAELIVAAVNEIGGLIERVERLQKVADAARAVEPYTDALLCYASTIEEHHANGLVRDFCQALEESK